MFGLKMGEQMFKHVAIFGRWAIDRVADGRNDSFGRIDGFKGDAVEIGFNAKYLMDFLQVVGTPEVQMELKDGETQGLLRPSGAEGIDYRYVVMPMSVSR